MVLLQLKKLDANIYVGSNGVGKFTEEEKDKIFVEAAQALAH